MYAILVRIHRDGSTSPFDSAVYTLADAERIMQENPSLANVGIWWGEKDELAFIVDEYHRHRIG